MTLENYMERGLFKKVVQQGRRTICERSVLWYVSTKTAREQPENAAGGLFEQRSINDFSDTVPPDPFGY